jgi:hypothetical protein
LSHDRVCPQALDEFDHRNLTVGIDVESIKDLLQVFPAQLGLTYRGAVFVDVAVLKDRFRTCNAGTVHIPSNVVGNSDRQDMPLTRLPMSPAYYIAEDGLVDVVLHVTTSSALMVAVSEMLVAELSFIEGLQDFAEDLE